MDRRQFALASGAGLLLARPALAQADLAEGKDYMRLQVQAPVAAPPGKAEVVEFFGYWCPHCYAFEPALDAWVRSRPPTVAFRRVAVAFNAAQQTLQKLYFAIDALGLTDSLHRKVFDAVHLQHQRFSSDADVTAFATAHGADAARLVQTMNSFAVTSKARQVPQLLEAYRVDGVPLLGIQGRYLTAPSITGSHDRTLKVADALARRALGQG